MIGALARAHEGVVRCLRYPCRRDPAGACVTRLEPCRRGLYPLRRWRARGQVRPPDAKPGRRRRETRDPTRRSRPEPQGRSAAAVPSICAPTRATAALAAGWHRRGAQAALRRHAGARGRARLAAGGRLGATVVQPCVATLAPVTTRIETGVTRRYLADWQEPEGEEAEMPEDDTTEALPDRSTFRRHGRGAGAGPARLSPRAGRRDWRPAIRRPRRHADDRRGRQAPGRACRIARPDARRPEDEWTGG
jgi:hypothetical protein